MKSMFHVRSHQESGSVLMCVLGVVTVLSLVAANLLLNSTTRYNTTAKQVKGWKEALVAAEGGADLAFAEVRLNGLDSTKGFATTGNWTALPTNSWEIGYAKPGPAFGANNSLHAKVTVDKFQALEGKSVTDPTAICYYRIRSIGTVDLGGFSRAGMDDRMNALTKGDSLLRKIDFNYNHFLNTYGYGDALPTDAPTVANGKGTNATVSKPQISRRVELIAIPVMPIEGAVKTNGGAYSFPVIDSFDSQYGAYPGPTPSSAPYNTASNQANVVDGSSTFSGTVYGSVTTNGGSASSSSVTGVIDNNVPVAPVANMKYTPGVYETNPGNTITPPARAIAAPPQVPPDYRQQTVFWYHYTSISGLTINPAPALYATGLPAGGIIETTVNIVCDGDVDGLTVNRGALARIYFSGNVKGKANTYDNNNADGIQVIGITANPVVDESYRTVADATTTAASKNITSATASFTASDVGLAVVGANIPAGATIATVTSATTATISVNATATGINGALTVMLGYEASPNPSRADHLWFYGEGTNQTITLASAAPSTLYAGWYAPNADWSTQGNPDFVGAAVVKSFSGNGNNSFHYDLQLASSSIPLDYRVGSFIEDVR
ncbi:MAG: hypothetical protein QOJ45_2193 [Verrucomicrobiota bacterium]|jgi:hypothetical protein